MIKLLCLALTIRKENDRMAQCLEPSTVYTLSFSLKIISHLNCIVISTFAGQKIVNTFYSPFTAPIQARRIAPVLRSSSAAAAGYDQVESAGMLNVETLDTNRAMYPSIAEEEEEEEVENQVEERDHSASEKGEGS